MKKRVVLIGSMSDLELFKSTRKKHEIEYIIYPTEEHLKRVTETVRLVNAPVPNKERWALMIAFFDQIRQADEVWILNKKKDKHGVAREYVGIGTAIDLGYALALGKPIKWMNAPNDPNVRAIFEGYKR